MATTFTLHVTFYGLCLFVPDAALTRSTEGLPDPAPTVDLIHVLLVDFGGQGHGHGGNDKPKHLPRLVIDDAYTSTDGAITGNHLSCTRIERLWVQLIDGLERAQPPAVLPAALADLNAMAGVPRLAPEYLYGDPGRMLAARITLRAGTSYEIHDSAHFSTDRASLTNPQPRTARLTATMNGAEAAPICRIVNLDGSPLPQNPAPSLHPVAGAVHVSVYNSAMKDLPPADEPPHAAKRRDPADHFEGYFELFPSSPKVSLWLTADVPAQSVEPSAPSDCKQASVHAETVRTAVPVIRIPQTVTCIMAIAR
jgi:hypothetical protein